jgi:hypothetical protein
VPHLRTHMTVRHPTNTSTLSLHPPPPNPTHSHSPDAEVEQVVQEIVDVDCRALPGRYDLRGRGIHRWHCTRRSVAARVSSHPQTYRHTDTHAHNVQKMPSEEAKSSGSLKRKTSHRAKTRCVPTKAMRDSQKDKAESTAPMVATESDGQMGLQASLNSTLGGRENDHEITCLHKVCTVTEKNWGQEPSLLPRSASDVGSAAGRCVTRVLTCRRADPH